jgi:hypothetical protein
LSASDQENIWEAVFRYQFDHNESGVSKSISTFCLSLIKDMDPTDEFIQRFATHIPRVKKQSECEISNRGASEPDVVGYAIDKQSGHPALIFRIDKITWRGKNEVIVQGGYFSYSLSAETSRYYLQKKGKKWTVMKRKLLSID